MTSYPNPGGRPDDLGRYASTEDLTPDEGVLASSTEDLGGSYEPVSGSVTTTTTTSAGSPASSSSGSKTDAAKSEAAEVKDTALSAGSDVASTAKAEAGNVAQEVGSQARGLLDQLRSDIREQGSGQKDRIASTLHSLSKELGSMASKSDDNGPITDLAHQASRKGGEIAHWLENHDASDVLEEVKRYARRRPVAFLAICAGAGIVAGRLTRGAVAANTSLDSPDSSSANRALPAGPSYQPSEYVASPGPYAASAGTYAASAGTYATSADPYAPGAPAENWPPAQGAVPGSTGMLNGPGDGYDTGGTAPLADEPGLGQGEYRR